MQILSDALCQDFPSWDEIVRIVSMPLLVAWLVTPLRFTLEYIGINENYIFVIGLLWFSLGLAVYWSLKYANRAYALKLLMVLMIVFSPLSRIPVAIAWWFDVEYQLGTHYGWYFDSFHQVLINHMFYGALIQLLPSLLLAALIIKVQNSKVKNPTS